MTKASLETTHKEVVYETEIPLSHRPEMVLFGTVAFRYHHTNIRVKQDHSEENIWIYYECSSYRVTTPEEPKQKIDLSHLSFKVLSLINGKLVMEVTTYGVTAEQTFQMGLFFDDDDFHFLIKGRPHTLEAYKDILAHVKKVKEEAKEEWPGTKVMTKADYDVLRLEQNLPYPFKEKK